MANEQNLTMRGNHLSPEQVREQGRRGGIASGEARRRRRLMRESLADLLKSSCPDKELRAQLDALGLPNDTQTAILFRQIQKAMSGAPGDTDAAKFLRDTVGERPAEQVQVTAGIDPAQDDLRQLSDDQLDALEAEYRGA